jgi:cell wall-associated NlpC family hydrolase
MRIPALILCGAIAVASVPALAAEDPTDAATPTASSAASASSSYFERASELVVHALSLIGVNYKFGGNTPDRGFDCSGLVDHVFQAIGGPALPRNSQAMSKVGEKIAPSDLQPGDLVFFNTLRRPFSHVGIYIGEQRFVHAPRRNREVEVADMSDRYWQKRYNGARRVNF